jgi:REP element-mobilizing transposase RayT
MPQERIKNTAAMTDDRNKRHRRSNRLQDYDYSQRGAYFVTLCTHQRGLIFGAVVGGIMQLNQAGQWAERCWLSIPNHFPQVELDVFVVMPNHLHGVIVIIDENGGAKDFSPLHDDSPLPNRTFRSPSKTVGSIVRGFKIGVTKWFRENTETDTVWQRNYYEHVIRNDDSLSRIRQYVLDNAAQWAFDRENPAAVKVNLEDPWFS